jgi:hypothetical protein
MNTTAAHHGSSNSFFQFADAAFLVIISQRISGQLVESLHKTVEIVNHWLKVVMKLKSVLKCGQISPQDKFFLKFLTDLFTKPRNLWQNLPLKNHYNKM